MSGRPSYYQSHSSFSNNSLAICKEIQRFESVHPSIYAIYDLIEHIPDPNVAQQVRDHVVCIEGTAAAVVVVLPPLRCIPWRIMFPGGHCVAPRYPRCNLLGVRKDSVVESDGYTVSVCPLRLEKSNSAKTVNF